MGVKVASCVPTSVQVRKNILVRTLAVCISALNPEVNESTGRLDGK